MSPGRRLILIPALAAALLGAPGCAGRHARPSAPAGPPTHTFVLVGTATRAGGQIATYELDPALGDLTLRGQSSLAAPPAALAAPGHGRLVVAALARGKTLLSLAVNPATGALSPRGRASSPVDQPAAATVDGSGHFALVTDDRGGTVTVVAIKPDGTLDGGVDTFAAGKGAHGLTLHPSNQVAFVANRRAGTLSQFSFNAGTGILTARPTATLGLPRDSGPRQVVCHPSGRITYVLNETSRSISVHPFDDRMGTHSHMAFQIISTLPADAPPARGPAGNLGITPAGRHLYVTDPQGDALISMAIDQNTGGLTMLEHQRAGGEGPEALAVEPQGHFLIVANRKGQSLAVFRLDASSGRAQPLGITRLTAAPLSLAVVRPQPAD